MPRLELVQSGQHDDRGAPCFGEARLVRSGETSRDSAATGGSAAHPCKLLPCDADRGRPDITSGGGAGHGWRHRSVLCGGIVAEDVVVRERTQLREIA